MFVVMHHLFDNLNKILLTCLQDISLLAKWSERARHFADTEDLYSLPEKAADIILGEQND